MRRRMLSACCAALLVLLCACAPQKPESQEGIDLYFAVNDPQPGGQAVGCEHRTLSNTAEPVEELLLLLFSGPTEESGLIPPFPNGVTVLSWRQEEGRLTVDLSEQYGDLSGIDLTIANSCLTLTLCQLESVDCVSVTVKGNTLFYQTTQQLDPDGLLLVWPEASDDNEPLPTQEPSEAPNP